MSICLYLILVGLLFIGLFYLIGYVCALFFKLNYFSSEKILIGLILAVSFYSIFITEGKTILSGLIFLFVLRFIFRDSKFNQEKDEIFNSKVDSSILVMYYFLVAFFIQFFCQLGYETVPKIPHSDLLFYSRISEYLNFTGHENDLMNTLNPSKVTPYHYLELWLTSMLSRLLSLKTLYAQQFLVIPILVAIVLLSYNELINITNKNVKWLKYLLPLILFIEGFYFSNYQNTRYLSYSGVFTHSIINEPWVFKMLIYHILLVRITIAILLSKKIDYFFYMSIFPIITISSSLSIAMTSFASIAYLIIFRKYNLKAILLYMTFPILAFSYIYLFYKFNSTPSHASPPSIIEIINTFYNPKDYITRFNIIAGTSITIFILYLPYILLLVFYYTQNVFKGTKSNIVLIYSCLFLTSLLSWALTFKMLNSVQLFANMFGSLVILTIIYLLVLSLENPKVKFITIVFCLFVTFYFGSNYFSNTLKSIVNHQAWNLKNFSYFEKIKNDNHLLKSAMIAYCSPLESSKSIFTKQLQSFVYHPAPYLSYLKDYNFFYSISVLDTPLKEIEKKDMKVSKALLENAQFYQFVMTQKKLGSFKDLESSKYDFILKNKIPILIVEKNAIPPVWLDHNFDSCFTDKTNGSIFYFIKNNSNLIP